MNDISIKTTPLHSFFVENCAIKRHINRDIKIADVIF